MDVTSSFAGWRGSGIILVIDDDDCVRAVTRKILESAGFHVCEACDGATGITLFQEHRHDIRAVLLDLTMPGMGGEETFQQLRVIDPQVRVLLMTGYPEQDVGGQFSTAGLAGFVQKPFRMDLLLGKLRLVLGQDAQG